MASWASWLLCWAEGCYEPAVWYLNPNWGVTVKALDVVVCTVHLTAAVRACVELQRWRGDPTVSVLVEPLERAPLSRYVPLPG